MLAGASPRPLAIHAPAPEPADGTPRPPRSTGPPGGLRRPAFLDNERLPYSPDARGLVDVPLAREGSIGLGQSAPDLGAWVWRPPRQSRWLRRGIHRPGPRRRRGGPPGPSGRPPRGGPRRAAPSYHRPRGRRPSPGAKRTQQQRQAATTRIGRPGRKRLGAPGVVFRLELKSLNTILRAPATGCRKVPAGRRPVAGCGPNP